MSKANGLKRKEAPSDARKSDKKQKTYDPKLARAEKKRSHLEQAAMDNDEDFEGLSDNDGGVTLPSNGVQSEEPKKFKLEGGKTSAEAHAEQRRVAKERKAAKPHADIIQRAKQLWERLRRKSHVPKDERKELVAELFSIVEGRVRDFVFKHDSVRVIQCAIKYARPEQLKTIVRELQNDVRELAASKYGKHLVGKMVVEGDREDKDLIIPQFYGHVKRFINHPEASWIMDDIYRQVATPKQKDMLLREWYGTEFALFGQSRPNASDEQTTSDLRMILEETPEKRKPILGYLKQMIDNLIQKQKTGFTMLHDAMLQYFLALEPGTEDHSDFLEMLKGDIDAESEGGGGDLYRNLSFTKNGCKLVCYALAYGSAKDRKVILKCFKDHVETMAYDQYAKMVLVAGLDLPDDTKMTSTSILQDLLGLKMEDTTQRFDRLSDMMTNLNSRLPILYPLAGPAKWLVNDAEKEFTGEIHKIRETTSKKAPEVRRQELIAHISAPLLEFIAERAQSLVTSSFASQAVTEILLECHDKDNTQRDAAKKAVAALAAGDPNEEGHVAKDPATGRMLRTLVSGGSFDPKTKKVVLVEPRLGFGEVLYPVIKDKLVEWACCDSSFVVVSLLESEDVPDKVKNEVKATLEDAKKQLKKAAEGEKSAKAEGGKKDKKPKGNAGARILLEKI
ncbi:Pumilio y domain family member 6 [Fulvia fulva]|uniref:Pumilio y domain family member 6 n=1 Tax=Passalora fulva TaxID=5499 RepID=A0A9Q8P318_PASFU|nr:Pumilio y domain family member 6 [Fulvia fulva]KAK4634451.1 Pumilio y domain family member 6 [Fulvia fulva]KAK4637042.1 Pumilio y domain family member 6 [Fulvia fulva]UJO11252.1 Pumilio y domain family member 6 [Fulvia fulva]WPV08327.1 Pumilio y domain family member 6 [Fulvia fulva]WPV24237.1 Pumilio y domain family member 6 [Fulvia fulva]